MITSAFKKNLNFRFSDKSQGINVRILERPGLWMEDQELAQLVKDLNALVKLSIKDELNYGLFTGQREHLKNVIVTVIYDSKTNEALAFNCLCYMDCELGNQKLNVLHLGLIIVRPDVRQGGFSWILYGLTTSLIFLRNRLNPIWISNVTQVPSVVGKVSESFGDVFPNPKTNTRKSFTHLVLAREILKKHRSVFGVGEEATFNEEKFIIENSYTGGSDHLKKKFVEAQPHRNSIYNDFCEKHLDYDRGDDYIQLGVINSKVIYQYATKDIPNQSILNAAKIGIFMLFQGLIMPLVSWFQANQHQGMIRPWKN